MADAAANPPTTAETKPEETTTRPIDADATMTDAPVDTNAGAVGAEAPKKEVAQSESEASGGPSGTANAMEPASEGDKLSGDTANDENVAAINGAAQPGKKDNKRKSIGKASEPKGKKLNRKKSIADLHLNCKPGEFWWARTKGNPPWPSLICDEDMLPDTLLSKRPVSAARADGTIRDDFQEGGKNMRDRRFPIMFLGTNEFAWQVNTDLRPLDISEVNEILAKGQTGKVTKKLWQAYEVCAENHDLEYFKNMLKSHYETTRDEERRIAEEEAKRKEAEEAAAAEAEHPAPKSSKKEKGKRKSTTAADKDVDMADAEDDNEGKKAKGSSKKKRKAQETGDEKPAKTPKTTLKLKAPKEPQEESAKKSQKTKAKKASKASDEESTKVEEKPSISEAELKEKTRKTVLYLRHRLQKGFLTRDSEPKEEEMADMAEHFKSLEEYKGLEPEIIKLTKIHKVLKAIIRLNSIPKDEEYGFKKRSHELLGHWNKALAADTGAGGVDGDEARTNGIAHDDEASKSPEKKDEEMKDVSVESEPATKAEPPTADAPTKETQVTAESTESVQPLTQPSVDMAQSTAA